MKNRALWLKIAISFIFLFVGLVANYYATIYATEKAGNPVTDLILSNIPTFDVDGSFVVGPILFWLFIAGILLRHPRKIPFALKSIGFLLVIRSLFMTLTHIGPFPERLIMSNDVLGLFSSGGDLFFSGHTALPFLMALIFWHNRTMRVFCLIASAFFGIIVLLAHVHYSIDVAAAFFITYSIYHLSTLIFKQDLADFRSAGAKI